MAKHNHTPECNHEHGQEEIMLQMRFIEAQIGQISQELQIIDARKQDVDKLIEGLDELKKVKENSLAYSPIGPGVFVKSQIKDTKNLLVNVGAGIVVKKSVDETKKLLGEQAKQLDDAQKKLNDALQIYYLQAQSIQSKLQ